MMAVSKMDPLHFVLLILLLAFAFLYFDVTITQRQLNALWAATLISATLMFAVIAYAIGQEEFRRRSRDNDREEESDG